MISSSTLISFEMLNKTYTLFYYFIILSSKLATLNKILFNLAAKFDSIQVSIGILTIPHPIKRINKKKPPAKQSAIVTAIMP